MASTSNRNEPDRSTERAWVDQLRVGLAESDGMIRTAALADGWTVVRYRGRVIRNAMRSLYEQIVSETAPRGAFAIHALGGTGRQEICPGSDVDIGIVVENVEENKHFLHNVTRQLREFEPLVPGLRNNVKVNAFPDLRDSVHFDLKSLASLLDADLLAGDVAFDRRIRRVCQQRAAELGLDFIFAINEDLRQYDQRYPQPPGDVGGFHVKDGIGGLRNFQMTMWLYSFERWIPSMDVYQQVRSTRRFDSEGAPTPDVLDAAGVIFSVRAWIEQRRQDERGSDRTHRRASLFIDVEDMDALRNRFGAEGLTELNAARQIIRSYRHETWDRLLERGVVVPDTDGHVVLGNGGLRIGTDALFKDVTELFYSIYAARQRFGLPIDQRVKRAARKNIAGSLRADAAFFKLMSADGSVFASLEDWFDYGALDQLVPGFADLAHRIYQSGHRTATLTRAARAMQRVENLERLSTLEQPDISPLESFFVRQYEELGESARGALRLALLTEEIPETLYGTTIGYADAVRQYVEQRLGDVPGLSGSMLKMIEFLLLTKREFLESSELSDQPQVIDQWRQKIADSRSRDAANTIRALALFTYAAFDFRKPEGMPRERLRAEEWENVQNLTQNLLYQELGISGKSYQHDYFDQTGQRIGQLLPRRLLASPHVDNSLKQNYEGKESLDPQRAHRIIHALGEVVRRGQPKVELTRNDQFFRLVVFAWDFPGLFWRVAGALYDTGCVIRSTDLYDIPDPGGNAVDGETTMADEPRLICDVLSFDPPHDAVDTWQEDLKLHVLHRLQNPNEELIDNTSEILAGVMDVLQPRLTDLGSGQAKFSCHSPSTHRGMRYAIGRLLAERAGASIESVARDGTRDWPIPRTNFYVRIASDLTGVADALRPDLGEIPIVDDALGG